MWKNRWSARRADLAALALIALAFCLAFGWALFRGKFLIGGDVFFYTYPMRTVAWRMIRHGELPLWTPLVLSGFPLLAMIQLGLAYPLTWTHLFLPDHWAEEIYVLSPFLLAPAFTYAYARELGRTRKSAMLAGLVFGYSGLTTNALGMNGIPTNAMMWLPLLLIALERARPRHLVRPLIGAAAAYTPAVLTGHAQSFLLVGAMGGAYALFLAFTPIAQERKYFGRAASTEHQQPWLKQLRWQPLLVAGSACVLSFGIAAFQILETMRAARRSIRHSISYDIFSEGSFTLREAVLSFIAPLYHYIDVTTYVAPLAAVLASVAIVGAIRHRRSSDVRIFFWVAVAVVAAVLMLGEHTPLYRLLYHIPVVNLFRVPSRHAYEWTFSLAVLAAYGCDALRDFSFMRRATEPRRIFVDALLLAMVAFVGMLWFLSVNHSALGLVPGTYNGRIYFAWKILFTVGVLVMVWRTHRGGAKHAHQALLMGALFLGCICEPLILISRWWPGTAKPASRFTTPGRATQYLEQFPPETNRVFTRANLGVDENVAVPRVDVLNQPAIFGLHNAGGYEALLLERYSRALGDVDYDAVRPRAGVAPSLELFGPKSHVLDLLNVTHVVAFNDVTKPLPIEIMHDNGIEFAADEPAAELRSGHNIMINGADAAGDTLMLVTSLANSVTVEQNATAARLRLYTADGQTIGRELLAGRDTAEWAHERADVRTVMKHGLAPVFDRRPGDAANTFPALRYRARISLGARASLNKIEITNAMQSATLAVWKITVYDSVNKESTPLAPPALDPARWQTMADFDGVLVLRNQRALPRAWLAAEAEAVDGEQALRRIRGEGTGLFDPRRTALIEADPNDLPTLPGGEVASTASARIVEYAANKLAIDTSAPTATVLVVSEIFYPGWVALVDGQPARIVSVDYLLRGLALPAGSHRVEMRYTAPAARSGAIISMCTLLVLAALTFVSWRTRTDQSLPQNARSRQRDQ